MISKIVLQSSENKFNNRDIESYLDSQDDILKDPLGSSSYLVCGIKDAVEGRKGSRLSKPERFPYCGLIHVQNNLIIINQEMSNELELISLKKFFQWMLNSFECTIHNDYGQELNSRLKDEGIDSFYPPGLSEKNQS